MSHHDSFYEQLATEARRKAEKAREEQRKEWEERLRGEGYGEREIRLILEARGML